MSRMKALAMTAILALPFTAHADVFLLADGSRLEGIAIESGDHVTISTFDGRTVQISKKDIRASSSEPARNEYFTRLKKLSATDADGRVALAEFCQKNKLTKEADALLHDALKINPAHEGAGKALGYEFVSGKWQQAEDPNFSIGTRPPPKHIEATSDQAQALLKKLAGLKVDQKAPKSQSAEVAALVGECAENPAALNKLLLPPQFPGALARIPGEIRTRAAIVAGMTQDRRTMQALCDAAVYDPEEPVRFAAAKALPLLEEPVAIRKLMDIAISGDPRHSWALRKSACIALRRYGSQEVLERLFKELSFELAGGNQRDPKNKMRGKGIGVGSDNPLGVQDVTPPDYGAPDTDLYPVLSAVKEVTGQSFDIKDKDMKTWIAWWKKDGPTFQFKD